MTSIEKIDKAIITFDKQGIKSVNTQGGAYDGTIYIGTTDDKEIRLAFQNTEDLKNLMQMLMTNGLKMDWTQRYPAGFCDNTDGAWSFEDVLRWKAAWDKQIDEASEAENQSENPGF